VTRTRESHAIAGWMQAVLESDEDLLAEVLRLGVQGLMEAERDAYVNAGVFERNAERKTHRNGYQDRAFYPSILERYQRSEAALVTSLAECYVQGVSTRKVSRICEELFGDTLSRTRRSAGT
jgi:putative transposase